MVLPAGQCPGQLAQQLEQLRLLRRSQTAGEIVQVGEVLRGSSPHYLPPGGGQMDMEDTLVIGIESALDQSLLL